MREHEADRIVGLAQSDIRLMSRRCMEVGGVNLGQGICDQPTPDVVKDAAIGAIRADESIDSKHEGIDGLTITDEIDEYILYDGHEHVSLASLPGMAQRTITLSGFSKIDNMTGWRLR